MKALDDSELKSVTGGNNYMNMKLPKLQQQFERACRRKNYADIMLIAGELQARGYYAWAKETAAKYGITSL